MGGMHGENKTVRHWQNWAANNVFFFFFNFSFIFIFFFLFFFFSIRLFFVGGMDIRLESVRLAL